MSTAPKQLTLPVELGHEPTLEGFLPGPNAEALGAVAAAAEGRGDCFVYLTGATGTGKTHLLHGACLAAALAERRAHYCPLGRPDLDPDVLDSLEELDLVALDDLELIAGIADWEQAVFGLFNRLREHGRTLLVASASVPAESGIALPDLRSRLGWGPRYRLRGLSDEDCQVLLTETANRRGIRLEPDIASYILARHPRDPASLMELLDRIASLSLRERRRTSRPLIRRAMDGEG